jgi:hypothetical protein
MLIVRHPEKVASIDEYFYFILINVINDLKIQSMQNIIWLQFLSMKLNILYGISF